MPKQEEVKYTKTHEWISVQGEEATVGLSEHAQHEMGDIVFVELPKPARNVEKEKPCAVVESVKSAFDIYAPVSGQISALNDEVTKDPALINQSPMDKAWLFKIKLSDAAQIKDLMDWNAYQEFVKQNAH
ncbi:MAG: glycine cleavage system protein H [Elusimicrobia bacterium GWA2_56_46]|nr:MAG: glycine cleavage system protein H [Elusimicrobia bacterium GWA2_56_46]OGR55139.1 MAG: glycine cleavage system protein H [Elusimicrobia bacterium GWC2_56_31]OGS55172.1 MAG: glycine cleavage system protein H [Elusimicrobia bacterium RIFOXYB2_FULL_62_6]HBB66395.1 glycine cleavage system protein GcvH [Elusimicrobiota bacterium]HBW22289.1 glycine cleavage system protein GcvH [Elusimicrobiota bacterium]